MSAIRSGPGALAGAAEADLDIPEDPDPARRNCTSRATGDNDFVRRLRRQRQIETVYLLGAHVVDELIDEIARHHDLREDIDRRLAMYAAFAPVAVAVAVAHGDKFAPPPLHVVGDGG